MNNSNWNKNTNVAYTRIMEVDAGKAGLSMSDTGSLIEHYTPYLTDRINNHPDAERSSNYDEVNPHNVDLTDVDWFEILVSCHHMYGYRLNGQPLAVHSMPLDWHP
jgi:hypothetical protein